MKRKLQTKNVRLACIAKNKEDRPSSYYERQLKEMLLLSGDQIITFNVAFI